MPDIQLSDDEQRQISNLINALGQDADLRSRLESNPRAVFGEYGLESLLPQHGEIRVGLGGAEVEGFSLAKHKDLPHADTRHNDYPHADSAHNDIAKLAGFGISIVPESPTTFSP
jgi:hypothetical protein